MVSTETTHARVGVFLARHCILGELNTGPRRVSDVLNDPSRLQIPLERVRVSRLDRPGEPFVEHERMLVRRLAIEASFVMSERLRPREKRLSQYISKAPYRLAVVHPAIDVTGCYFVVGKLDPILQLFESPETFIAI